MALRLQRVRLYRPTPLRAAFRSGRLTELVVRHLVNDGFDEVPDKDAGQHDGAVVLADYNMSAGS